MSAEPEEPLGIAVQPLLHLTATCLGNWLVLQRGTDLSNGSEEPGRVLAELDRKNLREHWTSWITQAVPNYYPGLGNT